MENEIEHRKYKIVMIGDVYTGKSSLLVRFSDDQWEEDYSSTIGVDFRFRAIQINNTLVNLQIWDTTGQEKYKSLTEQYFKGANGIIFVFDLTDKESFINLQQWVEELQEKVDDSVQFLIVGNKWDAQDEIVVTERDMIKFEKKYHVKIFEASARDNVNVTESFVYLTKQMMHVDDVINNMSTQRDECGKDQFSNDPPKAQKPEKSVEFYG